MPRSPCPRCPGHQILAALLAGTPLPNRTHSVREIADILAVPRSTVHEMVGRGRALIAQYTRPDSTEIPVFCAERAERNARRRRPRPVSSDDRGPA